MEGFVCFGEGDKEEAGSWKDLQERRKEKKKKNQEEKTSSMRTGFGTAHKRRKGSKTTEARRICRKGNRNQGPTLPSYFLYSRTFQHQGLMGEKQTYKQGDIWFG